MHTSTTDLSPCDQTTPSTIWGNETAVLMAKLTTTVTALAPTDRECPGCKQIRNCRVMAKLATHISTHSLTRIAHMRLSTLLLAAAIPNRQDTRQTQQAATTARSIGPCRLSATNPSTSTVLAQAILNSSPSDDPSLLVWKITVDRCRLHPRHRMRHRQHNSKLLLSRRTRC